MVQEVVSKGLDFTGGTADNSSTSIRRSKERDDILPYIMIMIIECEYVSWPLVYYF